MATVRNLKTLRPYLRPIFVLILTMAFISACGATPTSPPTAVPPTIFVPPTTTPPLDPNPTQACTFTQVCSPGEDWEHECISSRWVVYPLLDIPIDEDGCYQQPIWKHIFTIDGNLTILAQHKSMISSEVYGIFTQLPQSSEVRLTLDLDLVQNGDVWVGVFATTDIDSEGVMIVAPPGKVEERAFAIKGMPKGENIELTDKFLNPDGTYSIGFNVYNGAVSAVIENKQFQTIGFTSNQRWLFIGYRAKLEQDNGTANITATFSNLKIISK